jgi:quercetin dioxygenase-like cupin family protein
VPKPGQLISNPITGERIVFRRTSAQTGGERLEFDVELRPGGVIAGFPHRHPQTEHFHVTSGRLVGWIEGRGGVSYTAGQKFTIQSNLDHLLGNGAAGRTRARVVIRPPDRFDEFFETVFELSAGRRPGGLGRLAAARRSLALAREIHLTPSIVPQFVQQRLTRTGRGRGGS